MCNSSTKSGSENTAMTSESATTDSSASRDSGSSGAMDLDPSDADPYRYRCYNYEGDWDEYGFSSKRAIDFRWQMELERRARERGNHKVGLLSIII